MDSPVLYARSILLGNVLCSCRSLKKKIPFLVIVKIGRERKSFSATNEQKKIKFKVTAKYNT